MIRFITLAFAAMILAGCSLLFPEDWREGEEAVAECVARLEGEIDLFEFRDMNDGDGDAMGPLVPTYTYDITKMSFERKQQFIAQGADETLGTRLRQQFNDDGAAMDRFMNTSVDEDGAFFFGANPALFRVRGEPMEHSSIIRSGCERQGEAMRLLRVSAEPYEPASRSRAEISGRAGTDANIMTEIPG